MIISIPPVIIAIILIYVCNCFMSFGKRKLLIICHIVLTSVFSIVGIAGMITLRFFLVERLNHSAVIRSFSSDFVSWAIIKYDLFAVVSIAITITVILFFLCNLVLSKKRTGYIWRNTTIFIICIMIALLIAGIWYGLGTINKIFDVAGYISQLTVFEFLALHIPFVVKRILYGEKRTMDPKGNAKSITGIK